MLKGKPAKRIKQNIVKIKIAESKKLPKLSSIKASSNKDDIVMDIFAGSGTVMKVAKDEGRKWLGIDKELKYCKIAQKRVMSSTNK